MKHMHHIIPKHMGGNDDPTNLVELTIEEHAQAHKELWEKHGLWQDFLAWQGLSKLIPKQELTKILLSEAGKKGALHNYKRKGMKYTRRCVIDGRNKFRERAGTTTGTSWYHNPKDPTQRGCFKPESIPEGWIKGQARRS